MALLDPENTAAADAPQKYKYASIGDFLRSDAGMALASGLLSGNRVSDGLAKGFSGIDAAEHRSLQEEFQKLQMQNLKSTMQEHQRKLAGDQNIRSMIDDAISSKKGPSPEARAALSSYSPQQGQALPGGVPYAVPGRSAATTGNGLFDGMDEKTLQIVKILAQNGDTDKAMMLLLKQKPPGDTTQFDPNTGEMVTIPAGQGGDTASMWGGGSGGSGGAGTGMTSLGQVGAAPTNILKNPMMGTMRGGQGGTFIDKTTGKIISTDTTKQAAFDQSAIAAIERIKPQIERIANTLPQFQQAASRGAATLQGWANNYLNANYQLPSDWASGKAALESAPEGLLKAFGLTTTDQSLNMMRKIIEPVPGESKNGYKTRVINAMKEFSGFAQESRDRLAKGIQVGGPGMESAGSSQAGLPGMQPGTQPSGGIQAEATKSLGGKNYIKVNGQWYQQ